MIGQHVAAQSSSACGGVSSSKQSARAWSLGWQAAPSRSIRLLGIVSQRRKLLRDLLCLIVEVQVMQVDLQIVQRVHEVFAESVWMCGMQPAESSDSLAICGECVVMPIQFRQMGTICQERRGQVGGEGVRAGGGQLPVQVRGFLDGGQRVLAPPQGGTPDDGWSSGCAVRVLLLVLAVPATVGPVAGAGRWRRGRRRRARG